MSAARCLALAALCGCGGVGINVDGPPVDVTARRAVVSALRAALVEGCRAHAPDADTSLVARLAWVAVCGSTRTGEG